MKRYKLRLTASFRRDYKKVMKRQLDMNLLKKIVDDLQEGKTLPEKNKDHSLTGDWKGYRECHIAFDWLLVYRVYDDTLILSLVRTGTHSDLDLD